MDIAAKLEKHYNEMQDVNTPSENGRLWLLQTDGKRTAKARSRSREDMANEGLIDKETAVMRVEPEQVNKCCTPIRFCDHAGCPGCR